MAAMLLFAMAASAIPLRAQEMRGLESLVRPDGTLDLESGFNGTLDASGWTMMTDGSGRPVFTRAESAARIASHGSSGPDSFPGDQFWQETFGPPGMNGVVYAMAISNGNLYVGGKFTVAGNAVADNIARWNGSSWRALGNGVGGNPAQGTPTPIEVRALAVQGEHLIVGGSFSIVGGQIMLSIARWNTRTESWSPLGAGVGIVGTVRAIAVDGQDIYVGGDFSRALMRSGSVTTGPIARWNGTNWSALGTGIPAPVGAGRGVYAVALINGDVYAGGGFREAGGVAASGIARFDGTAWSALAGGLDGPVLSMIRRGTDLVVGGGFTSAGSVSARHIALWSTSRNVWQSMGSGFSDSVMALAADSRYVYAGGHFVAASGQTVGYIARWDGVTWSTMLGGVADTLPPVINAIAAVGDSLYAGGRFITAGNVSAHNVARWNGSQWYPMTRGYDSTFDRNGTSANVYAVAVRGDDVYVGGDFRKAGPVNANFVAKWDGEEWSALGSGIDGAQPFVRALAVAADGDLYAGGIFSSAGGVATNGIARWDGTRWHAVGGGVGGSTPFVFSILSEPNGIVAAGAFTEAGGVPAGRVARWNGTVWSALGEGVRGDSSEYVYITSLARLDTIIYAGGSFARAGTVEARNIASWDGTGWNRLDSGVDALVSALAAHNGELVAGGEFSRAGDIDVDRIAVWNGSSWTPLASSATRSPGAVRALTYVGDVLYAAGEFTSISGIPASYIAAWDGSLWRSVGRGTNAPIFALAGFDDLLYAGGAFTMAASMKAKHVARWDAGQWSALGSDPASGVYGMIRAIAVDSGNIYVGGAFSAVGGVRANNVARWNGKYWSPLGRGRLNGVNGTVLEVEARDGEVYAGGMFTAAGNSPANFIAHWDGGAWQSLGDGVAGNNPYVFALALDGDDLYVGGAFSAAGSEASGKIARWNRSTRTWHPMGEGVSGGGYYTYISSIAIAGRDLYAGGNFSIAGRVNASSIARWDGAAWHAMGSGVNNSVFKIIADHGRVFISGDFTRTEPGVIAMYLAEWTGSQWLEMNGGANQPVFDMALSNGELYIGGSFTLAGQVQANAVARWDGRAWQPLGRGVGQNLRTGIVYALAPSDSGVFVGGDFTTAGGRASYYFGRWQRSPELPSFVDTRSFRPYSSQSSWSSVRPLPAREEATLEFLIADDGATTVGLYDAAGTFVGAIDAGWLARGEHALRLPTDRLPSGHYTVVVRQTDVVSTTPLVIRR